MQKQIRLNLVCITFLLLLGTVNLYAQQGIIKGTVSDSDGETLIGVSVGVKGMPSIGAVTNYDGRYELDVPKDAKTLTFSYVGMKTKDVPITGNIIDVTMEENDNELNEVVVIGYGEIKRRDLTGAVSSIDEKTLKDIPVATAMEAMKGRMAGVNVTTTEGSPDAEIQIRVRGGGSITQDNSPLYIVDGFPVSSIADIAPGDIQSIDVLKDASSTAIYGSQGANGVIIITTKGARTGKMTVNLNAFVGVKNTYNLIEVLSPYEYVYYQKELDPGASITGTSFYTYYGLWEDVDVYRSAKGENWQDRLYGNTGLQQNYNVSITGGTESLRYNLSYTHDDEDYIMLNSAYRRDNINLRTNAKLSPTVDFDFTVRLANTIYTGPSISSGKKLRDGVKYAPVKSLTTLGNEALEGSDDANSVEALSSLRNPMDDVRNEYKEQRHFNNTYNAGLTWKIIKPLRFRTQFSYVFERRDTDNIWTKGTGESSSNGGQPVAKRTNIVGDRWTIQNNLTYDVKINKVHALTLMVGQEMDSRQSEQTIIQSKFYPSDMTAADILSMWNYGTPLPTYTTISEPTRTLSFFSRANYTLNDRYLFSATIRADGKNVFAPGNRWGYFPSVAGAWRISDEAFMESNREWLSNLKLRATYGQVGNARVSSYWRKEYGIESTANKLYYPSETVESSLKHSTTLHNENLTWETKVATNIGLDFGFFDQRLSGTIDVYNDITKDLIMKVPLPTYSGYDSQYQNVGQTSNKGVEISLTAHIIEQKDFSLSANFNIAFNRNRVDKFVSTDGNSQLYSSGWGLTTSAYDYLVEEGKPIGQMYGYVTDGMYSFDDFTWDNSSKKWVLNDFDANGNRIPDISTLVTTSGNYFGPGHIKLKDLDGDGEITEADRQVIGNAQPKHTGGFGLNASWKGFDMSALFNWSYGNDVYNANKIDYTTYSGSKKYNNLSTTMRLSNRFTTIDPVTGYNIYHGTYADPDRLQELNQDASIWHPIINSTFFHSWAIEDGSFLRLNTLTLGYTFPTRTLMKLRMQNLRVYVSGYNLYCWTNYSGQDPEVDTRRSTPLTPGVDYSAYPKARTFVFGINATF